MIAQLFVQVRLEHELLSPPEEGQDRLQLFLGP